MPLRYSNKNHVLVYNQGEREQDPTLYSVFKFHFCLFVRAKVKVLHGRRSHRGARNVIYSFLLPYWYNIGDLSYSNRLAVYRTYRWTF